MCFSPLHHCKRNQVERFFSRIRQCRHIVTRYEKLAILHLHSIFFPL
ncbi:MAG: transposase [Hyphomicrobiales bacterium]|nr:transposase [Hyphomicrobiales bacterium]